MSINDLRELSISELETKVSELKKELMESRFSLATSQIEDTSIFKKIKKQIGSAFPMTDLMEMEVTGRNLAEGLPRKIVISSNEILESISEPLQQIVMAVKEY